jgi:hypothetical protein
MKTERFEIRKMERGGYEVIHSVKAPISIADLIALKKMAKQCKKDNFGRGTYKVVNVVETVIA